MNGGVNMAKKEINTDLWVNELLKEAKINLKAQGCNILEIDNALKTASKNGTGNVGYPEFCGVVKDYVIVIEDKAEVKNHIKRDEEENISRDQNDIKEYAVNGALFYAQHIGDTLLPQLFAHRENLLKELNKATRRDEDEYKQLCSWVMDYEQHLKKVIAEINLDWVAAVINTEEYIMKLKEYLKSNHNSNFSIDTAAINEMFQITETLSDIQGAIYGMSRHTICDITTSVLDNN